MIHAHDIPFGSGPKTPAITSRLFRPRGENTYSLELLPAGITFLVERLRRSSAELWGELTVTVNGSMPTAKTIGDRHILSSADMNFSSTQARSTRAKHLKERCGLDGETLDWVGFLEELSIKAIDAERHGEPAVVLADYPQGADEADSWVFEGFPVLKHHPTVLFGKGASAKSMLALWLAGQIAQTGVPVLYFDWELAGDDHRRRLERLFPVPPRGIQYVRCDRPLRDQVDRITRLLRAHQGQFAVFDSIGPASRQGGRFGDADLGQEYFGLIRQFGVGSLHVAHPPKHVEDEKDATIIGSSYFGYLARSIWYVKATENNPAGEIVVGLYHHKLTTGPKLAPRAYRLIFEAQRTQVVPTDLKTIDELVAQLPLVERIVQALAKGPATMKVLAADLNSSSLAIRQTLERYQAKFVKLDAKTVGLAHHEERF